MKSVWLAYGCLLIGSQVLTVVQPSRLICHAVQRKPDVSEEHIACAACRLPLLGLLFDLDYVGDVFIRNVGPSSKYTALQPTRSLFRCLLINMTQQGLAASTARFIFKQHDGLYTEVFEIG
jgi:hypothetical protein